MSTILKITTAGKLIEQDTIYDERFKCPHCKKEAAKIEHVSIPHPISGSYRIDYYCEDCGEEFFEDYF